MKYIKFIGLGLFLAALGLFIGLLLMTHYKVDNSSLKALRSGIKSHHQEYVINELQSLEGQTGLHKFNFIPKVKQALDNCNKAIAIDYGIDEAAYAQFLQTAKSTEEAGITITEDSRKQAIAALPAFMQQTVNDYTGWLVGRRYETEEAYSAQVKPAIESAINGYINNQQISEYDQKAYVYEIVKATSAGSFWSNPYLYFILVIIGGTIGALMYIFPAFFDGMPGIKHNHIYHHSATSKGLIGILTGVFLIGFYIMLYFYHYYIAEWITLMDPVSMLLRGEPAGQWFMYGFLYTIAIVVMGIRMFAKYRHSNYHKLRTASVMFFQTAFAFLIPQFLYQLNLPEVDLKNIWPLDYTFFFNYRLDEYSATEIGVWMMVWGLALIFVGVPIITYFFGKRWYCSWVCGCGGLAETLGDPYRQLSDKTAEAWQIERIIIHGVLIFAVVMTTLVLYTYFAGGLSFGFNRWLAVGISLAVATGLYYYHRKKYPHLSGRKVLHTSGVFVGFIAIYALYHQLNGGGASFHVDGYSVRSVYGFSIGSMFAGVIGTGFYPLMGNRVWCRFGCPLAGYLGIVQRFKSKFRITTNGGQCISCGNCSTYCEMGIDVRHYAQRGQNIVRSSCVGCGVCSAVCPRGVLALENGPNTNNTRMEKSLY